MPFLNTKKIDTETVLGNVVLGREQCYAYTALSNRCDPLPSLFPLPDRIKNENHTPPFPRVQSWFSVLIGLPHFLSLTTFSSFLSLTTLLSLSLSSPSITYLSSSC